MTGSSPEPPVPIDAEIVEPAPPQPPAADDDEHGIPSFDHVRDKIEGRYGTALGSTELAEGSTQARSLDEQQAERERAAAAKLAEIRRQLDGA